MKKTIPALLSAALLLLAACDATPPAVDTPTVEPTPAVSIPMPTPTPEPALRPPLSLPLEPEPTPVPYAAPTPVPTEKWGDYEPCYIGEIGATLLLPKSWSGNYEIDDSSWEQWGQFSFFVKDYESSNLMRVVKDPIEEFEDFWGPIGEILDAWEDNEPGTRYLWLYLGEQDGVIYRLYFPTDWWAAEVNEEKYALYQAMQDDLATYPGNASAYFIFDTP